MTKKRNKNISKKITTVALAGALLLPMTAGEIQLQQVLGTSHLTAKAATPVAVDGSMFYVTPYGDGVEVAQYNGTAKDIIIPSYVNGKPVRAISTMDGGLTTVILPPTLTHIKDGAFDNNFLTNVVVPEGVKEIGSFAFKNNKIETLVLPETLKTIGMGAFDINQIKVLKLPKSLTTAGTGTFSNNLIEEVDLGGLTKLEVRLFENNKIKNVTLPEGITEIPMQSFRNNDLRSITFPSTVQKVLLDAFKGNPNLSEINLNEGLVSIATSVFEGSSVKDIKLPSTLESIGISAFKDAELESLTLPSNLKTMLTSAFWGNNITKVVIPASVTSLSNVFAYNPLEEIEVEQGNKTYMYINKKGLYLIGGYTLFVGTKSGIIENGTGNVSMNAFTGLGLKSVSIPSTVVQIGEASFMDNELTQIKIPESVKKLGLNSFSGNKLKHVVLPTSMVDVAEAFQHNNIKTVVIPSTTKTVSDKAFHFNQAVPSVLTIYGFNNDATSGAVKHATTNGYTYKLYNAEEIKEVEATIAVEQAESSLLAEDILTARPLVNDLQDGVVKTDLTNRLDALDTRIGEKELLEEATAGVEKAELDRTQSSIDTAQGLIDKLSPSTEKGALQDRLDSIKNELVNKQLEDKAKESVTKAETDKTLESIADAQQEVDKLPDGTLKDDLNNRLDLVREELNTDTGDGSGDGGDTGNGGGTDDGNGSGDGTGTGDGSGDGSGGDTGNGDTKPDVDLGNSGNTVIININNYFNINIIQNITIVSSDTGVATVAEKDGEVIVTPVGTGSVTITIEVTDENGVTTEKNFTIDIQIVVVIKSNDPNVATVDVNNKEVIVADGTTVSELITAIEPEGDYSLEVIDPKGNTMNGDDVVTGDSRVEVISDRGTETVYKISPIKGDTGSGDGTDGDTGSGDGTGGDTGAGDGTGGDTGNGSGSGDGTGGGTGSGDTGTGGGTGSGDTGTGGGTGSIGSGSSGTGSSNSGTITEQGIVVNWIDDTQVGKRLVVKVTEGSSSSFSLPITINLRNTQVNGGTFDKVVTSGNTRVYVVTKKNGVVTKESMSVKTTKNGEFVLTTDKVIK